MELKTLKDVDLTKKRVILRVAYDITLKEKNGTMEIPDDTRIRATLPTIQHLLEKRCAIVLITWLKRPGGKVVEKMRLDPVARKLSELINKPVKKVNDCVGPEVQHALTQLKSGELLMLENTRFHPEEEADDPVFAEELAKAGECIVFDAFAHAHRKHASTTGILKILPACAGFLMEKEMTTLDRILQQPERPFVALLGGVKISDKVGVLKALVEICDAILIGGALANTFLKAQGKDIGASLAESEMIDKKKLDPLKAAQEILQRAETKETTLVGLQNRSALQLPVDFIAAQAREEGAKTQQVSLEGTIKGVKNRLPSLDAWMFLDIGPKTRFAYQNILSQAKTILWNGPVGAFETKGFEQGTKRLAQYIASQTQHATTVTGGGDTEAAITAFHLNGKFTHNSTGGGAMLKFLSGKELPVLHYLVR